LEINRHNFVQTLAKQVHGILCNN